MTLIFDEGAPRSLRFDDIYYMPGNGREESRYVFVEGTDIPRRIAALSAEESFTVFEAGFGTGLNFCETYVAFKEAKADSPLLDYTAIEKFPVSSENALAALRSCDVDTDARMLCAQVCNRAADGETDIILPFDGGRLRLIIGDIADIVESAHDAPLFNAVYLDGFAPAKNPEMWSDSLFSFLAAHAVPKNTICATFTAAGAVRRALTEHGFFVERLKGFRHKRHMVQAKF